ncbi:MAG: 2-succinyl-6-hydroxy-2,4-cyclohexadiene-1-carboxylate synthase [Rubrobacteraceae bacterium]
MDGLDYEAVGDPEHPTILFLHGFMGSSEDWKASIAALEGHFYCITVDLPGHGESLGLPPEGYTMEGATRSLADLLNELGVGRVTVVGYSMGGRLALYFALRHPERCTGLFLESTSPGLEDAEERAMRRQADEERAAQLEAGDFEEFLKDWYRQPIFASLARDEELLQQTIESRRQNEPEELARSLRSMGTGSQPTLWGEISGLRPPALAVAGELDEKFIEIGRCMESRCMESRCMESLSPEMRFAKVAGASHNVHVEAPKAYLSLLRDFLESL